MTFWDLEGYSAFVILIRFGILLLRGTDARIFLSASLDW